MSETIAIASSKLAPIIAATPLRTDPTVSNALVEPGRLSAAWIVFAFVLSRYAGSVVANQRELGTQFAAALRKAMRPASTPIDVVSSSKLATARSPLPPPAPSDFVMTLRCKRQ